MNTNGNVWRIARIPAKIIVKYVKRRAKTNHLPQISFLSIYIYICNILIENSYS